MITQLTLWSVLPIFSAFAVEFIIPNHSVSVIVNSSKLTNILGMSLIIKLRGI